MFIELRRDREQERGKDLGTIWQRSKTLASIGQAMVVGRRLLHLLAGSEKKYW